MLMYLIGIVKGGGNKKNGFDYYSGSRGLTDQADQGVRLLDCLNGLTSK